ncbi:MAG: Asp-tRNA(Asn)/Glu-tRNA(Gln) amidotransferase subunit GatB [Methanocellales archaeon]|nr:Asp-tRNA(Asn)/Glu-tRNA(Gln) amidotransferase subunit GatB [Methanocellales archaeon]
MKDVIIGLEVHVQLNKLRSKLFCSCSTQYHDSEPDTHTCPVCLGLPGALPVTNGKAVDNAIKVALALNCNIEEWTMFYRKNYYYPDLVKGFQISQYDYPIATNGSISLETEGGERTIRIKRVHMEEDPGRLVHVGTIDKSKYSLIDYNRSGVALLEVVTEPDLRTPKEARLFLNKLKNILEYLDVFDSSLEGSLRVDANISIAGGKRAEIKNISSYKGVEKALLFEIVRQNNLVRRGVKVVQETRHFDEVRGITISLRTKEGEEDYRYFPEPDLVPITIVDRVDDIKKTLPELPDAKRQRFVLQYGISDNHAKVLISELGLANFFETVATEVDANLSATWIADVLKGELNYRDLDISAFSPGHMVQILQMLKKDTITENGAVQVIRTILDEGGTPLDIVERKGLQPKMGAEASGNITLRVIEENPDAFQDFCKGKNEAMHFLMGQVMKETHGTVDRSTVIELLNKSKKEKLQNASDNHREA